MFRRGDQVVYGIHGVCSIIDIVTKCIDKKQIEYYVLEPIEQIGARYYIPTQNQAAVSKLRSVLTLQELDALLHSKEALTDTWISDENQRKQYYKDLITSGDRVALIRMVHTLHNRRKALLDSGKKFHICDENFLRDAKKLLTSEFSLILNIDADDVEKYVKAVFGVE